MSDALDRLTASLSAAQVLLTECQDVVREMRGQSVASPPAPLPASGITPRKITNAGNEAIVVEYSTVSAFSEYNDWLLLIHPHGNFGLYTGTGEFVHLLPAPEINASSRPRWSNSNKNAFTYFSGNQLKQFDVTTDRTTVIRTFVDFKKIDDKGEADLSEDGDHRVIVGDDLKVFLYGFNRDKVYPWLAFDSFESAYVTPDNNVLISGAPGNPGVSLYDSEMRLIRSVAAANGHKDVTRDQDGSEVMCWINSADDSGPNRNAKLDTCPNGAVKVRLRDGKQTCLVSMPWSLSAHISGPSNRGWVLMDTYRSDESQPETPLTDKILMVSLDGSGAQVLCDHKSRPFNEYNWQPRVSVSRDGSRFVFNSNSGIKQANKEASDVWLGML